MSSSTKKVRSVRLKSEQRLGVSGDVLPYADWWDFIRCQNYGNVKDVGNVDLAQRCAKLVKHDWDAEVASCADGKEGRQLLRDSVTRVKQMGIKKSCSIIINGKVVCVHDGRWKDCDELDGHEAFDFASYIKRESEKLNSA